MGTHPIFESDFDCLTDCQALRLAFEMAKKETEAIVLETPTSPPISLRTRNRKIKECFVTERLPMNMEESGDAPVTTNVVPIEIDSKNEIEHKIEHSNEMDKIENLDPSSDQNGKDEGPSNSEEVDELPSEGISTLSSENERNEGDEAPFHGSEPDVEESEDVTKLSNKELKEKLTSLGITTGPIVDSTRKIYERKLEKLLTKGKDLAYSTDEDAVPEQEVESEDKPVEPIKEKKRTKKAQKSDPKSDPVIEEKFSDEEDEEPVVKNSSSRRRSARILKSKSKKDTEIEQIEEQEEQEEEGQNEEAEVEQEESLEDNIEEEVEVEKESKSTESVQVLSTKTAITSHIHTILFLALVAIAGYLLYSEAEAIESALSDIWDYSVESYSRLYYSMMPEIETIQPDTQPAAEQPVVGEQPVPTTDEL